MNVFGRHYVVKTALVIIAGCVSCAGLTSCGNNYAPYRESVKVLLRDPDHAQFKHEQIRTLWSKEGARLKVYCAMVNDNNAFGGKTGFLPAQVIISTKTPIHNTVSAFLPTQGKAYIDDKMSFSYYLTCVRPDTERHNLDMFAIIPELRPWDDGTGPARAAVMMPVISNKIAPPE